MPPEGDSKQPESSEAEAEAAETERRLPFAAEFSPGQVELKEVLDLVAENAGDLNAIVAAIKDAYPKLKTEQRRKNVLIAMGQYGLYDSESKALSTFGEELRAAADDATRYEVFAKHILADLHGVDVLQVVRDLRTRQEKANKSTIDAELRMRGFKLPADTTHHIIMLGWLQKAGLSSHAQPDGWEVDEGRVKELLGIALSTVDEWAALPQAQRFFLLSLQHIAQVAGTDPVPVKQVRRATEERYGVAFRGSMRSRVINPLEEAEWLTTSGMQSAGKSGKVAATQKLLDLDVDLATRLSTGLIPPQLRKLLNTPLPEIYKKLDSQSKNERGIGLELLALRLAYDVGLAPMGFRVRSADTGQAEVDLIAEGAHLLFSRWLFQCKATKGTVQLSDLAKEIGMATLLHAQVIVMVARGRFSTSLREHAAKATENTALQVVLIDGKTLTRYKNIGPAALLSFLHNTASDTLRLKRPQVAGLT